MRMPSFALWMSLLLPSVVFGNLFNEEPPKEEIADNYSPTNERDRNKPSPRTNPRWYRNPEARKAYLRGEPVRHYPRKGNVDNETDTGYYRRRSNRADASQTNPGQYKNVHYGQHD